MSSPESVLSKDAAPEDEDSFPASSRRVWKRHVGGGASMLTLKTMGVLYDAGVPLTRDEMMQQLIPLLDPYERGYLEEWYARLKVANRRQDHRRGKSHSSVANAPATLEDLPRIVVTWLTRVFLIRASPMKGNSLRRDADGRYRPGPTPPNLLTLDGQHIRYTLDVHRGYAARERDKGRAHLAQLEWKHLQDALELTTPGRRVQLLCYLIRRFLIGTNVEDVKQLNEVQLAKLSRELIRIADTATVQRRILQSAFDELWNQEAR
jgi:hypothetical protein